MKLGQLKRTLNRISPDMDDMELVIQTGFGGEIQYDLLTFIAKHPDPDLIDQMLIFGTLEATRVLVKNNLMKVPDDYVPGGEKNEPTNNNDTTTSA